MQTPGFLGNCGEKIGKQKNPEAGSLRTFN